MFYCSFLHADLSHAETRLTVFIDSCELHVYNRSQLYANLEKLFGLEQQLLGEDEEERADNAASPTNNSQKTSRWNWRDLIPVVKFEISAVSHLTV
jgi:hypothetical protein